ncbi:hypothetical protein EGH67_01255 [Klebsiella aerogenes]|nr:hypothetical protein CRN78_08780 [Klebsiella aerogenes]ATY03403.1 hypothetical protein AM334_22490 [Klebsiella aerogenes]AWD05541.1 hypothetical protein AM407_22105 [Klebsiella aerogenes]KAA0469161.1 hypothetical protein F0333_12790 [Klebsiella aerogenes]MBE0177591.1 hypothetical protein [Klebsiella aerogenes]
MCVGRVCSPQSLTRVSSWGFTHLPPSCNSNYLGYNLCNRVNIGAALVAPFSWMTLRWDCLQKLDRLMLVLTSLRWYRWRPLLLS